MEKVEMGRKWEIETKEDYEAAMETLKGNEFIAEMCDDFYYWQREKDEVARQRADVIQQAKMKGVI